MRTSAIIVAMGAVLLAQQARAAVDRCDAVDFTATPRLEIAQIKTDQPRVHFIEGNVADASCPSLGNACQLKSYLVPGDLVIQGKTFNDMTAVDYGAQPHCVPAAVLAPVPLIMDTKSWIGAWHNSTGDINIAAVKVGLTVRGDATWGGDDPARVANGGVNTGDIDGTLIFKDQNAIYAAKDASEDDACKIRMARAGDKLFVQDNNACGGINVSFSGIYKRTVK